MRFNAVIVAGGRGSRLDGRSKPLLVHNGKTLLEHALRAVAAAERIAVVGPADLTPVIERHDAGYVAGTRARPLLLTREEPTFGGPAAAVAAGVRALAGDASEWPELTVVLAADLIEPGPAVAGVLAAARGDFAADAAWVPVDEGGRLQPLSCVVASAGLVRAIEEAEGEAGGLANSSMMRLLAKVQIVRLSLDGVAYDDIDTWEDAGRAGIILPPNDERSRSGAATGGQRGRAPGT
ncbi:molybdenum cofactor guanylyltransferase [Arthrobacter sp. KK5.5]|uniref:molybdenum cofactor guanylyltransferase n=1 Tax=Arthrobacter sp. KK5.5 TaxID=3373084 RepID=UPI003EE76B95